MNLTFAIYLSAMDRKISAILILGLFAACTNTPRQDDTATDKTQENNAPPLINYSVIGALPHDTSSFTEGLLVHDGQLFESTGTEPDMPESRHSLFGVVDRVTGKIDKKAELDRNKYFGEGISFVNIDADTGKLATPFCPKVINESFLAGTEPVQVCDLHR